MNKLFLASSLAFLGFLGWIVFLADTGRPSVFFDLVRAIPAGDKLGHAMLFGTLTLGLNLGLALHTWSLAGWKIYRGAVIVVVLVVAEELSQAWFPNRTLDAVDLLADAAGIVSASIVCWFLETRRRTHPRADQTI